MNIDDRPATDDRPTTNDRPQGLLIGANENAELDNRKWRHFLHS